MSGVVGRVRQSSAPPTGLPHHLTSFIGRVAELRSLRSLIIESRLVTITGTGGAGKSRLAAELAKATIEVWPDGVWWVELAAADDVAGAIIAALKLPGRGPAEAVVTSWLSSRKALLILDNCEHLVAASAAFCQAALRHCPHLSIVATSREALGVPGEVRWPLSPLRDEDTLRLFEARARLVAPDFTLARSDVASITEICERLDRLPLALEMAASRLDIMSERELLGNLKDRFRVLTSGARGAPARQQTMTAAIDWSHRLLSEDEARLFRRLAVFQGGFTVEAAQAVCAEGAGDSVIGLLRGLVQKSMVVADRIDDGTTRFRLLESHHAFALDRLRESADLDVIGRRQYEYFVDRLAARTVPWTGPNAVIKAPGIAPPNWKGQESANFWAALDWARANTSDRGLGLAVDVADFEFIDHTRAKALLLEILDGSTADPGLRAKAYNFAARLALREGDLEAGRSLADTSVSLARDVQDPELLAYILDGAGTVYRARGELDTAGRMFDEARSLLAGSSNRRLAMEVENSRGLLEVERGDHAAARAILAECVAHSRSDADQFSVAKRLESLANAQLGMGDPEAAAASWTESLTTFRGLNDPFGTIWCLGGLALVAAARADHETALLLAAVVDRMSREWSLSTGTFRLNQLDEVQQKATATLGERKSAGVWKGAQAMGIDVALDYALGRGKLDERSAVGSGPLSRREREVVAMVAAGMTSRQIAERLFIAERTAEGHVERIRTKLGLHTRSAVAAWAVEHGIVAADLDKPPFGSTV